MRLYNTLTREKEEFTPAGDEVTFYACGPTVYNYAHLGNLRAYVFSDILRRSLRYSGFSVREVINITDVGHLTDDADQGEDKMEKGAKREGKSVWEIAEHYTEAFKEDIRALNIEEPEVWAKATEHIDEQWAMVQRIWDNGYAYLTADGIYFDTAKLGDYGKLVPNFDAKALEGGKRVSLGEKRSKTDFALWKRSPEGEKRAMEWTTTLRTADGDQTITGFPGWHIECTAMGTKYLGETFDLHTGGIDHIPIHHTNEIAQAQGAFGHDHVRHWMHNEFLVDETGKMAKSKGDFLRLKSLTDKGYSPLDYRYFLLLTHYRKPVTFSWGALDAAKKARERITSKVIALKESAVIGSDEASTERLSWQARFIQAVNDDLNTPQALAVLNELLKSTLADAEKLSLLLDWDAVLGLSLRKAERPDEEVPAAIQALVDEREKARQTRDWARADDLRDAIKEQGWVVSDTPEGPALNRA